MSVCSARCRPPNKNGAATANSSIRLRGELSMIPASRMLARRAARTSVHITRTFCKSAVAREAQVFDMPSMSPTMEEGGIVDWKFEPGDAFKAGDVLLEIETDKAEIAVEAGDDGVLAKILVEAGEKGIKVGRPIAVTVEEGDDLSSIDYDALLSSKAAAAKPAPAPEQPPHAEPPTKVASAAQAKPAKPAAPAAPAAPADMHGRHGTAPLPAAMRLIHEHHLEVSDISGSGPFGRITKGDVLAHLGKVAKDYTAAERARFAKLEKMDLSNVEVAPAKPSEPSEPSRAAKEKPAPLVTSASIPLTERTAGRVSHAQRVALRNALLMLKPKASVLRDAALDALTAPRKPPFKVTSFKVQIWRGKPVALDVAVEEPPATQPSRAVDAFLTSLKTELIE